jgi:hypothetical protein
LIVDGSLRLSAGEKDSSLTASLVIESRKSFFHGEFVTKILARVLFVLFVLGLSVPVVAQTDSKPTQAAPTAAKADTSPAKSAPTAAKKDKTKGKPAPPPNQMKDMKKYQKQQKKNQGKLLKAQAKAQKNMMKQQVGR